MLLNYDRIINLHFISSSTNYVERNDVNLINRSSTTVFIDLNDGTPPVGDQWKGDHWHTGPTTIASSVSTVCQGKQIRLWTIFFLSWKCEMVLSVVEYPGKTLSTVLLIYNRRCPLFSEFEAHSPLRLCRSCRTNRCCGNFVQEIWRLKGCN